MTGATDWLRAAVSPALTTFQWIVVVVFVLMAVHYVLLATFVNRDRTTGTAEGFDGGGEIILDGPVLNPYDHFYAKVYDQLIQGADRTKFEVQDMQRSLLQLWNPADVRVLDVGCGTGLFVELLRRAGFAGAGLDTSEAMVQAAQRKYPDCDFTVGDVQKSDTYKPGAFTHAALMYFTIYYFEDKEAVFRNLMSWIKLGGGLAVHVVNKYKFDPLLESASPFPAFSVQRYATERATRSDVVFDKFTYESNFQISKTDDNDATFREVFRFKDGRPARVQEHRLYMPPLDQIVKAAENAGFKYKSITDMVAVGYEYQYMVYFTR